MEQLLNMILVVIEKVETEMKRQIEEENKRREDELVNSALSKLSPEELKALLGKHRKGEI